MSSTNHNYDKSTQLLIEQMKQPFPLIDVDCNLLHQDLTALLGDFSGPNDFYEKASSANLRILHHPSTIASNIIGVFSPSSTIEESENMHSQLVKSTKESRNFIDVRMGVGVHPFNVEEVGELSEVETETAKRIGALMETDKADDGYGYITCVGETGLDYSEGFPSREKQLPWFEFQLNLAKKFNLPLFLHERLAFNDTVALIDKIFPQKYPRPPIIIHCFTGTKEECQLYISRGYYISVSGYILKSGEGPDEVRACLREGIIPLDKLMIETDAPYMGFSSCRESYYQIEVKTNDDFLNLNSKKRKRLVKGIYPNVPSSLPKVLDCVVELVNEGREERASEDEIRFEDAAKTLFSNSIKFFGMRTEQ